ncbi:hypothetical protein [Nocardia sp. XZ_19_369]|uniref:hypothetical protein n=1 Tax=Nocardia sp. XZ_19_369 TaxID=2769487 RepID=UPI00188ECF51|nr:hypothetical protein [Nocardia sp. XZ_19_369]
MRLQFLGKGGSGKDDCPSLYATDQGSYLVQGWKTDKPEVVEIPHLLLGFTDKDTYIGTPMADTGRGTFRLTGRPIVDRDTLDQLTMEEYETAIEVPRSGRAYYGGVPTD